MKIIIYALNYKPELIGIGKYTAEMAEWLKNNGHEIQVIAAPPYYPAWKISDGWSSLRYKNEVIEGVCISRCPIYVPSMPSGIKRIIHLMSFAISSFPKVLSKYFWSPDIIFVVEPPLFCSPAALILSKITGAKAILHIQDFEVDAAFELGLLKNKALKKLVLAGEKYLLSKFDCVSTISTKMIEKLNNKNVNEYNQYLFPNWVDTSLIAPLAASSEYYAELGLSLENKILLYSGNMGNKQGLEIVIEAAKQLVDEKRLVFIMCGEGSAKANLMNEAKGLTNIIWLPFQPMERLNQFLGLATVHLLPQAKQAADLVMPSKLTGMLSSGRPIIATAELSTQVGEVVNKCGIVVAPENIKAFVEAILLLVKNAELCKWYGEAARDIAERELDIQSVLGQFEDKVQDLIK